MSILPIDNLNKYEGGGKAYGLSLLKSFNMNTPLTFLLRHFNKHAIKQFLNSLPSGIVMAVRSSASNEDGEELSFAGQYNSFLSLKTHDEIIEAVKQCFAQVSNNKNTDYYNIHFPSVKPNRMHVLLQEMVDVASSGVIFTVDPVENRRDKISITITRGLTKNLMGGKENGEHITFLKHNFCNIKSKFISDKCFKLLVNEAKLIEKKFGKAADLEWVIDKQDRIWWIQLRPVSKLRKVNLNELDSKPLYSSPIYSQDNITEMMEGPVTPLTLSTFAKAIDYGIQDFYCKTGALDTICTEPLFVHSFYNYLFLDVNRLYESVRKVGLPKKENIDVSIVGEEVKGVIVQRAVNKFRYSYNSFLMLKYIFSASRAKRKLKKLNENFQITCPDKIGDCYKLITDKLKVLNKAYSLHNVCSFRSKMLYSAIANIISHGKTPGGEHQQLLSSLLDDIPEPDNKPLQNQNNIWIDRLPKSISKKDKLLLNKLIPRARKAIANCDQTIAITLQLQDKFKDAYQHLALQLFKHDLLNMEYHIFFLKHEEIGELINAKNAQKFMARARERYYLYSEMEKLEFNNLYHGIPYPTVHQNYTTISHNGKLKGTAISQGKIEARIRVIINPEDADKLEKGEIMVTRYTDTGWTLFYGLISGLITEIGSPLSHGAIVAREYELPAIVGLKGATRLLKTGQNIILDAVNGTVEILEKECTNH